MPSAALSADETVFVAVELRDEANDCYYYNVARSAYGELKFHLWRRISDKKGAAFVLRVLFLDRSERNCDDRYYL